MTKPTPSHRVLLSLTATAGVVALFAGGCGSSPRTNFYESREITAKPVAGTGEALGVDLASVIAEDMDAFASASVNRPSFSDR